MLPSNRKKVFEMKDGKLKVAPTSLNFLDKEDRDFYIQDNACKAEMELKCYKKSNMITDGNRISIKKIDDMPRVDQTICLLTPYDFYAVGQFYEEFNQVDDNEVIRLLREANNHFKETV